MEAAEDLADVSAATVFEVLPAGQAIVTPQRVLAGPNFASVLEQVSKAFDIVLVDTAPVGAVNDALPLLELVQQTIVVARFTSTTRDQARRVRRLLDNFDPDVLGLVLTGTPARGGDYYGGYAYQLSDAEQRQKPSTARTAD
jgi:tyrosine-protein kinase Etk/Wzc